MNHIFIFIFYRKHKSFLYSICAIFSFLVHGQEAYLQCCGFFPVSVYNSFHGFFTGLFRFITLAHKLNEMIAMLSDKIRAAAAVKYRFGGKPRQLLSPQVRQMA